MSKELQSKGKLRKLSWKEILQLIKRTFVEYFQEPTLLHAASLAYYTLFAMIPLIYLFITFFGRIVGIEVISESIGTFLHAQIGISDISGIMEFLENVDLESGNILLEIVSVGALIFTCSAFLFSLKRSINAFFDIKNSGVSRKKLLVSNLLFRLFSVVILGVLGFVIITLYFGETVLLSMGKDMFESQSMRVLYAVFLQHFTSILTSFLIFSCVFKYVHDGKVRWKLAMGGALVTSIMLYLGQLLIKYYLSNYFFAANGGLAGTFFVILAWVFYSAQIIFLGAKFTSVYAKTVGKTIKMKFQPKMED